MKVHIHRWGNSLAIRIPKALAAQSNINEGSIVDVSFHRGKIEIAPVAEASYTLEKLLAGVTKHNVHIEVDAGEAICE